MLIGVFVKLFLQRFEFALVLNYFVQQLVVRHCLLAVLVLAKSFDNQTQLVLVFALVIHVGRRKRFTAGALKQYTRRLVRAIILTHLIMYDLVQDATDAPQVALCGVGLQENYFR
jgi:hypothetical protein